MLLHEELTEAIIAAAIEVHRALGPGLLESSYTRCTAREMELRRMAFRREVELPIEYKGIVLECGYRMDFVVDEKIVLEIKAVEKLAPIHEAQLLTYLRLSGYRVGLLINFNAPVLRNSIVRRVL
ncbi:MAG TPA: GxxExxY protein [Tepidisphaeraceae bacterium]|nr:GxxExxY protein [Tepidisphaeraceae bacterium]